MGVEEVSGEFGVRRLKLTSPSGASATVSTHGAHVLDWQQTSGDPLLFVSSQAVYKPPKAIRGGIPICFPQFGDLGPCAAQHGFARNSEWAVESAVDAEATEIKLSLSSTEETLAVYPHAFTMHFLVRLTEAGHLVTRLEVTNTGADSMPVTCALHTYFATADISQVKVEGLKGVHYLDSLQGRKQLTEAADAVTFAEEVDRIYMDTPDTLKGIGVPRVDEWTERRCQRAPSPDNAPELIVSPTRAICLKKSGLPDAVVWNPWIAKAQGMGDFGDEEYKTMFCVEAALAKGQGAPALIASGGAWSCEQELSLCAV